MKAGPVLSSCSWVGDGRERPTHTSTELPTFRACFTSLRPKETKGAHKTQKGPLTPQARDAGPTLHL